MVDVDVCVQETSDLQPTSVLARDILLYRFTAIDYEGASIRDYDSLESESEKNQLLVKATTMDLLDLMKDFGRCEWIL